MGFTQSDLQHSPISLPSVDYKGVAAAKTSIRMVGVNSKSQTMMLLNRELFPGEVVGPSEISANLQKPRNPAASEPHSTKQSDPTFCRLLLQQAASSPPCLPISQKG
jgi:hypothetical protein